MRAHELSLAVAPAGSFAAWHGGRNARSAIYVQRVQEDGAAVGSPVRISDGKRLAYEPDLIATERGLVVAWYERDRESGRLTAWIAGLTPAGKQQWQVLLDEGSHDARNPVVRLASGTLHVAWIGENGEGSSIMHRQYSLDGRGQGNPRRIGRADSDTWNLNAAVDGDRFLVVYDAALSSASGELRLLIVDGDDVEERQLTPEDGFASLYPDMQIDESGRAALTWFDERDGNYEVYFLTAPLDQLGTPAVPAPTRVTHSPGETIGAYVAWNEGKIGLVWSDEHGGRRDIYAQTFTAYGAPASQVLNLSNSAESSSVPAIRAASTGFLIAWNDYVLAGSGHGAVQSSTARFAFLDGGN